MAVWLDTGTSVGTQELAPGIYVDRDQAGLIVGIEVLDASAQLDRTFLEALPRPGRASDAVQPGRRASILITPI